MSETREDLIALFVEQLARKLGRARARGAAHTVLASEQRWAEQYVEDLLAALRTAEPPQHSWQPGDRIRHGHTIDPSYEIGTVVKPRDDDPTHVWIVLDMFPNDTPAWTTADRLRPAWPEERR